MNEPRKPVTSIKNSKLRIENSEKGPELLGEILSRLFTARGWGRRQDRLRMEQAWTHAVGPDLAPHTRIGNLRRGVLEIEVANAILLQELASYHKRRLLEELRKRLTGVTVTDLRFKAGTWKEKSND